MTVIALHHREAQALVTQGDVLCRQPRRCLGRDAPQIQRTAFQLSMQLGACGVVHIDDGGLQTGPAEESALGQPVVGHAAVVVQVVLREVGEDGGVDLRAVEPGLGQSNRRGLDGTGTEALRHKLGKRAMQPHRVGRGHAGGGQRGRHSHSQSAHQRTLISPRALLIR